MAVVIATNQITISDLNDGNNYEIRYTRTLTQPTIPVGTEPAGWYLTTNEVANGYGNIWFSQSMKDPNGELVGTWSIPALYESYDSNLLQNQKWTVGQGSQDPWSANGTTATENERVIGTTPFGGQDVIWRAISQDAASDPEGGWNHKNIPIDHTKRYRLSVWVNKLGAAGTAYLGPGMENQTLNLDGTVNTNPYFIASGLPIRNKWYLLVGFINGSGDTSTVTNPLAGIYEGDTGVKVTSATTFKNAVGSTVQTHRAYYYYTTTIGDEQQFYAPRFDLADGNEPSIEELLRKGPQGKQGLSAVILSLELPDGTTFQGNSGTPKTVNVLLRAGETDVTSSASITWYFNGTVNSNLTNLKSLQVYPADVPGNLTIKVVARYNGVDYQDSIVFMDLDDVYQVTISGEDKIKNSQTPVTLSAVVFRGSSQITNGFRCRWSDISTTPATVIYEGINTTGTLQERGVTITLTPAQINGKIDLLCELSVDTVEQELDRVEEQYVPSYDSKAYATAMGIALA